MSSEATRKSALGRRSLLLTGVLLLIGALVYALTSGTPTVTPATVNTLAKYTIAGTTGNTGSLTAGSGTISVTFPQNTVVPASITASNVTVNGTAASTVVVSGQKVTVTTPVAISRSTAFTVVIGGTSAVITNPSQPGSYSYTLATSSETTGIASTAYTISASTGTQVSAATVTPSNTAAGAASGYTVGFNVGSAGRLDTSASAGANTVTVTFPAGTTVPTSIAAANVTVNGTPCSVAPSVSGQSVTVTTPVAVANSGAVSLVFSSAAGIVNPAGGSQTLTVKTSAESTAVTSAAYSIQSTLAVSGNTALATSPQYDNATGVVMQRVQVQANGNVTLNSLTLDKGTGTGTGIAAAKIYISGTSSSTLPGGATLLGSVSNWNGVSTAIPLSATSVGGSAQYLYVVYDMAQGQGGNSVASRITSVGVASPGIGATGLALSSNTLTLTASATTLTVSGSTAIASGSSLDSATGVVMQRLQLQGSGNLSLASITMGNPGTGVVGTARIYISDQSSTTLPGNAVQIGSAASLGNSQTVIPLSATTVGTTPQYLYVVYDMASGQSGKTVAAQVTSVDVTAPNIGAGGLNLNSNTITLTGALSVSANTSLSPANALDNQASVLMQRLKLQGAGAVLNSITLDNPGNAASIQSAYIYISATSQSVLPGDAVLIGRASNWNGAATAIPLDQGSAAQRTVGSTGSYLYIVYDMAQGQAGTTAGSHVTAIGVVAPNLGASGLDLGSSLINLVYSGTNLSVSNNTPEAASAKDSDAAVVMQRFQVDCSPNFNSALTVSSLTMQDLGSAIQIASVKIYVDTTLSDTLPATAKLIGVVSSWNKQSTTIPFVTDYGASLADMTVLAGTSKYIYVVYGMYYADDAVYVSGQTVQSKVTALAVASPDYGAANLNLTSNLITLSRGTWSKITSCGGCHNTATSGPSALRDAPSRNYNGQGGFPGSHNAHLDAGLTCTRCHPDNAQVGYHHANGKIDIAGDLAGKYSKGNQFPTSNVDPPTFGTCNTVSCHSNGTTAGSGSGPQYPTQSGVTWNNPASGGCGTCHGTSASAVPASASHLKHVGQAAGYQFACVKCHSSVVSATPDASTMPAIANSSLHDNGTIDTGYDALNNGATPYTNGSSCGTTYCHSNGTTASFPYGTPLNTSFTWSSAPGSLGCTGCHDTAQSGATATQLSGKHDAHTNPYNNTSLGAGNGIGCAGCHAKTVTGPGSSSIGNAANHVNGMVDYSSALGGHLYNGSTKVCSNIYCHSNGNPNALVFVTMTGNKAWNGSGESFGCNGCHGRGNAIGYPDYANGGLSNNLPSATANNHAAHVAKIGPGITDSTGCSLCHVRTTSRINAGQFRPYSTLHLSGSPSVYFWPLAGRSGSFNNDGTCSATYCHGSNPAGPWGAAQLACNGCHAASKALPGAHMIHYSSASVPTSYGTTAANNSSATVYQFACSSCHSSVKGAVHVSGPANGTGDAEVFFGFTSATRKGSYSYGTVTNGDANGFRWSANGDNCATSYCHSDGQGNNGGTVSWSTTSRTGTCIACHDTKSVSVTATKLSGKHDRHMNPTNNPSLGAGNGLNCADCHAKTVSGNTTVSDRSRHVNKFVDYSGLRAGGSSSYNGGSKICSAAYCHSNGNPGAIVYKAPTAWTAGSSQSCTMCHGSEAGASWNSTIGAPNYANGGAGSTTANSHYKHTVLLSSGSTVICANCHAKTVDATVTNKFKDYTAASYHLNGSPNVKFNSAAGTFNNGACSNLYCHSKGKSTVLNNYSTPFVNPVNWGQTLPTGCAGCHGGGNTAVNQMGSGSHTKHVASIACGVCHSRTSSTAFATYTSLVHSGTNYHANQSVDVSLDSTGAGASAAYKGSNPFAKTPGTGSYGACSNITCHSNGIAIWSNGVGTGTTPTWGQTGGCNACHGNSAVAFAGDWRKGFPLYSSYPTAATRKPNAHSRHADVRATNAGPVCNNCHGSVTASNSAIDGTNPSDHANAAYNVAAGGTFLNGDSVNTAAVAVTVTATINKSNGTVYTTCSNVSCHPTGLAAKIATNTKWYDRDTCTDCHKIDLQNNAGNSGYHHAMNNYSSGTNYPTAAPQGNADGTALPTGTTANAASRRCTMCHVKHGIFSPLRNSSVGDRSNMLRTDIAVVPTTTSGYANSDFIKTPGGTGGICISCHANSLTKSRVLVKFDNTSTTVQITLANYSASAHQYQINSAMRHTGDTGAFKANCTKCHNGRNGEVAVFTQLTTANHDNSRRRLYASIGGANNVDGNDSYFCYGCHTGAAAGTDYYKTQTMSLAAKSIQAVFNDTFSHPVNSASGGAHRPVEEGRAPNNGTLSGASRHVSCNDCHDPHAAKPIGSGLTAGSVTAFSAGTPDTMSDSGEAGWTTNQWTGYTVRITEGTGAGQESVIYGNTSTGDLYVKFGTAPVAGSKYIIFAKGTPLDGNQIRNTQLSTWGVNPTWPAQTPYAWNDANGVGGSTTAVPDTIPGAYTAITSWNRVESATIQGQICIKCHSAYAYGTTLANYPLSPSGLPNSSAGTYPATAGTKTMHESDVANDFNPNNLGYHPIFARGKNQPIRANYGNTGLSSVTNPNWPKVTGTMTLSSGTVFFSAALPKSVLPGWFVWVSSTTPPTTLSPGATNSGFMEIVKVTGSNTFTVRVETGGTWPNPSYGTPANIGTAVNCAITPGLGAAFVAPWGPWSLMRCTDCHESDTATDPLGPHGSANKYLLKKAQPQTFMTINSSGVDSIVTQPNAPDPFHFCHNCHRMDVYGGGYSGGYNTAPTNANLSRQPHPVDRSTADTLKTRTLWGTVCTNCHGGARVGEIHGSNLGVGVGHTGASTTGSGTSQSGQRLLSGAVWTSVTRSTSTSANNGSCYLKGAADTVSNCSNTNVGTFGGATTTYNY